MNRRCGISLILLLFAWPTFVEAAPPAAPPPASDLDVALLLFIDGRPQEQIQVNVGQLRRFTISCLEKALRDQGWGANAQPEIDVLLLKWRVRNDLTISEEFLQDCHDIARADHLLVVNLISQFDNLLLMARMIDCTNGNIVSIAIDELALKSIPVQRVGMERPPIDPYFWQIQMKQLASSTIKTLLTEASVRNAVGSTEPRLLLVLPTTGVATPAEANTAANHLFLRQILTSGDWLVHDPSLVNSTLVSNGHQPYWFGAEARRLLVKRFGTERIVLTELVSYDSTGKPSVSLLADSEVAMGPQSVRNFAVAMRMVDLRNGAIIGASHVFIDTSEKTQWFGQRHDRSLIQKLAASAYNLWHTFLANLEAS